MVFTFVGVVFVFYFALKAILLTLSDRDLELAFYEQFGQKLSSLREKVVVITGASSGIGEALAYQLAQNGVKLALIARNETQLRRVRATCLQWTSRESDILLLPFDITAINAQPELFDHILRHFGRIDMIVNNAGRSQRAQWENIELMVDRELFDLNVFAVVNFSRIAVKYFASAKHRGQLAVVSSIAGVFPAPFSGSYTASKYSLHGYFNSLRLEKFDANFDVTLFCPGPTLTNFLSHSFTETHGKEYGKDASVNDRRMTSQRCGYLLAVALANRLSESWVAVFPVLPLTYLSVFYPTLFKMLFKFIGPKYIMKLRDSKDHVVQQV